MGVKIHLLKRVAGPSGNWGPGSTIDVDEATAKSLVAGGAAERIDQMQPYVREEKRETATEKAASKRETAAQK